MNTVYSVLAGPVVVDLDQFVRHAGQPVPVAMPGPPLIRPMLPAAHTAAMSRGFITTSSGFFVAGAVAASAAG